jgi:very-short-patch-repair endonuclease
MADQRARYLRKNATVPERILWAALRRLKPHGLHFRRQAPMASYVVDFVCHSAKIVVEVDGSQDGEPEAMRFDPTRTAFLNSQGYQVLRFGNVEVTQNSLAIAEAIFAIASPPPGSHSVRSTRRTGRLADLPTRGRWIRDARCERSTRFHKF